jgi:Xaa-Pro aminopeptidase
MRKSGGCHPEQGEGSTVWVRGMRGRSLTSFGMTVCLWVLPGNAAHAQLGSPAGPIPAARLEARRAALFARLDNGVAIVPSAKARSIEGDYPQDSDYREHNDFFYLTGLEAPGAWLLLVARNSGPDQVILYLPARDSAMEKWTGPKLGPGAVASRLTGISDVRPADKVEAELSELVVGDGSPGREGGVYLSQRRQQVPETVRDLLSRDGRHNPPIKIKDLDPVIARLRLVKDPDEISRLRRATMITAEALKESMRVARPGIWEYELEGVIEYTFRRNGAERVGFPSIVASGPNAVTLHYDENRRQVQAGELVVEDVGAEFGYYSADITRTIPSSGRFTPRQRALYDLVLGTQQAAIDSVRPGTALATLERTARTYMRDHSGDLCGPASCVPYFIHGLSHWLGMDVHDVGSFGARLEPGMVLTVEPGIYIPAEGVGIRIEDDVLVTRGGHEVLSHAAPRAAEEIEHFMAHGVP